MCDRGFGGLAKRLTAPYLPADGSGSRRRTARQPGSAQSHGSANNANAASSTQEVHGGAELSVEGLRE